MRRLFLAAIAVIGYSTVSNAQWNAPPTPSAPASAPQMYGWNPCFKKLCFWRKDACGPSGCGSKGMNGAGGGYNAGAAMPGTLAFPVNPYMRSPRDFFMYEGK